MLRAFPALALYAAILGATVLAGNAGAQSGPVSGGLTEMPLPGGLSAALKATGDRVTPDRSRFLLEMIQRAHEGAPGVKRLQNDQLLQSLISHLERSPHGMAVASGEPRVGNGDAGDTARAVTPGYETLPLPLSSAFWIDTVFGGRATPDSLASAILRSRSASLLYHGLLSLDDETRAWLATQPSLIAEIMQRSIATFVVAAPALRVSNQTVRLPGGGAAEPAWQALIGYRTQEPVDFIRAVLTMSEGRLAYLLGAIAHLTPAQTAFMLKLDAADPAARVDAVRRLFAIFERNAAGWKIDERPFWRPRVDPAALVAELSSDDQGHPLLPGTRTFWTLVLNGPNDAAKSSATDTDSGVLQGEPVDFVWLCEQVFKGSQVVQRRPYEVVLFASRLLKDLSPANARHAVDAIRAATSYPALTGALERARVSDVAVYAGAARRAGRLSAIDDHTRAIRSLAQFQGALVLLTRAAGRGAISAELLADAISSLSAIETSDRGDYEGRLVRWLTALVAAHEQAAALTDSGSPETEAGRISRLDERVVQMASGLQSAAPRIVEWEGTRYRIDFARAETVRLAAVLGEQAQPYLAAAGAAVAVADALGHQPLTREAVRTQAALLTSVADGLRADTAQEWMDSEGPTRLHAAAASLATAAQSGNLRDAARIPPALLLIADDLLGRGLMQVAYAVALGQPERSIISAGDAASRHDFGLRLLGFGRLGAWRYPVSGADRTRDWRVSGSLLGLDLRLGDYALMPLSAKLPLARPTLNDADRRGWIETAVLLQPTHLTDADGDAIVTAIVKGRERVTAARSPADVAALATEIRLGPIRRTLLEWVAAYDRDRLASFLSPTELLWLGLDGSPLPPRFHAWGTSGEARIGCDCLQLMDRRSWESLAGRWDSGMLATAFADLNLRLAEMLRELRMPAALLSHVLPAAALDFVNNVVSRWQDDHRALIAFVLALPVDRVEQYLALLTTNGPLVPLGEGSESSVDAGRRTEVHR